MKTPKRICTGQNLDHSTARKVLNQLKINPEVCDECKIKPCVYALYLWGTKKQLKENKRKRG